MSPALHRAAPRLFAALSALAFLSLLSCGREVTGPETRRLAMLALAPEFSGPMTAIEGAGDAVPFEKVRVLLRREDGSILKDTVVDFPSDAESIALTLTIPIPQDAPASGLPLTVAMAYVNAAGDTVFRGGPNPLTARPVGTPGASEPVTIPVTYDGPGKAAARVAITPTTGTAVAGQTTAFSATAFDDADQPIANTPFIFSSLDTARASVDPVTGVASWRASRGTARIVAQLPNGLRADTATFTVALPASKLVLGSGNAQTGPVNAPLADTIVLRTLASDDVPVAGVVVAFAVSTGGGTLGVTTDTSDADGNVQTVWTLGGTLGAQTITATAAGLTGSPFTVAATATAATPVRLEIQAQPSSGTAGAALAPALSVIARDAFGNAVTTFSDSVDVSVLGTNPPPLSGTLRRAPVSGTVSFDDLSLDAATDVQFIVSSGALAPDTSATIAISPAAAASLAIIAAPPATVSAGATFGATVRVLDAFGNLVPTATTPVAVAFDASPAGASFLGGNAPIVPTGGEASFASLAVDVAGTYRLRFTSGTLTAAVSTDITVGPAAADSMFAFTGDGQTATAGSTLATPITVAVRDAFGNAVPGVTVVWTVAAGGGAVDTASRITDADGRAAVLWTLGGGAGVQSLEATASGLPTVTFSATALAGTPTQAVFTQSPADGSVADSLHPVATVEIRDTFGNRVTTYTGDVSIAFGSNPTAATLAGTTTVAAVAGIATFPDLRVETAGSGYTLVATTVTESIVTAPSAAFARTPAAAAEVVATGGDAQTVAAGAAVPAAFSVVVRDAFGNTIANQAVRFARQAALASIADTLVLTDANGVASTTGVAGTTAGSDLLAVRASVDGVVATADFTLTVTAGVATQVVFISQPDTAIAGDPFPPTLFVEFRDAFGNRVVALSDTVTMSVESGPVGGALLPPAALSQPISNGGGPSFGQFAGLSAEVAGTYVLRATTNGGLTGVSQPLVVVPNGTLQFLLISGNNDTAAVNQPFGAPLRVRVTDSFGNPIVGAVTTWLVQSGGASLAADTVLTDIDGYAQNTATHSGTVTALGVIAANVVGSAETREFAYTTTADVATQLVVTTQPPATFTAGTGFTVAVEARDAFGNRDFTYADSSFILILNGSVTATLNGITRRQMVEGRVEFTGLSINEAGSFELAIASPGLPTAVTNTAQMTAGPAAFLDYASVSNDGQVGAAGDTLAPFRVRVTDAFGNPVQGVTVTWTPTSGGTFVDATSLTAANGEAESRLVAPGATGPTSAIAEVSGLSGSPLGFTASLTAAAAARLAIIIAPAPSVSAGTALTDFVVRAQDRFGFPTSFNDTVRVSIVDGPVGGAIIAGGTAALADSSATFGGLTFDLAGSYTLEFRAAGLDSVRYVPISVGPGEAIQVAIAGGNNQVGIAGANIVNPLEMLVRDAFGNPVPGVSTSWFTSSGSLALLDSVTFTTDSLGVARATLRFGDTPESFIVTGSAGDAGSVDFDLSSVNGPATLLVMSAEPSTTVAGVNIGPVLVGSQDALTNPALDFVGTVTVQVDSGPAGATLGGTTSVTAVGGTATFSDLTLDRVGLYRLRFQSAGLGDAVSAFFNVTAAPLAAIARVSGDAQSDTVLATLANPLVVIATDAFGNPISGIPVAFSSTLGALVSPDTATTDAFGFASANVTLGSVSGTTTITARLASLPDSAVTFTADALAGNVVGLAVVSAPTSATAGDTLTVRIEAQDFHGNLATSFADSVRLGLDDLIAAYTATNPRFAVAGVVEFTDLVLTEAITYPFLVDAVGLPQVAFSVSVTAAPPAQLQQVSGLAQSGFATLTLDTAFTVQVRDAFSNPIAGVTVDWTVLAGSGGGLIDGLASTSVVTDANGQAAVIFTPGTTLGTQTVRATVAGVDSVDFDVTVSELIGNSVWTGNFDTDWANAANWIDGRVPFAPDSVLILSGRPNYPVLLGDVAMTKLFVEDGVTSFEISNHNVLVSGNIRVPVTPVFSVTSGTIQGLGSGSHTVSGTLPIFIVQNGSYSPDAAPGEAFTVLGDMAVATNGRLVLDGTDSVRVAGTFSTTAGGQLEQASGTTLDVGGNVQFGGGASDVTGGRLFVGGNFSTAGAEPAAFRAAATHETHFVGGVQSVFFTTPDVGLGTTCTASCFGRLVADSTFGSDTLRFGTDVKAIGGFGVQNRGFLADGRLVVAGPSSLIRADTNHIGTIAFINQFPDFNSPFVLDSVVAAGSGFLPASLLVPMRVVGDFQMVNPHAGNLIIEGTVAVNGSHFVGGSLLTQGSGRLLMDDAGDTLVVGTSAVFAGGWQAGDLSAGTLRVGGLFDASPGRFIAEPAHVTELYGSGAAQTGMFGAGPGAGQNRFGTLVLNKSVGIGITTSTPIFVDGQLRTVGADQQINGIGSGNTITVRGTDIQALALNNQPLVIVDGADVTALQDLNFFGFQEPGQAQLRIARSGGGVILVSPSFDSSAVAPPLYLVADDVVADADTLVITVSDPAPALNGGLVSLLNGARLVGWTDFPALIWTNNAGTDVWTDPLNWQQGRAPVPSDSVVVSGSFDSTPTISVNTTVRALTWASFNPITVNADLTITGSVNGGADPMLACGVSGRVVFAATDSVVANGNFACPVFMSSGRSVLNGATAADSLIIDGTGEFHLREAQAIDIRGDLRTADNGTLRLEGTSETVVIVRGNARFASTPTSGALTGGTIVVDGNFTQDVSPTAFQPGSDSRVVLAGGNNRTVQFAHPDPVAGSYFGDLALEFSGNPTVTLASDVFVQGRLIGSFNGGGLLQSGTTRTLRSRGAEVGADGGISFENVVWEIVEGDTLSDGIFNVSFASIGGSALPQLRVVRDSGLVTLYNFAFDINATAPLYLRLEDSNTGDGTPLQVTMVNPSPAFHGGAIDTLGGAQLLSWQPEPSFVWTGAVNALWTNAANWSDGVVPSATSVVTIPVTTSTLPAITAGPVTIRGFISEVDTAGVFLGANVDLIVTDQIQLTHTGIGVTCQDNTARLVIGGNATTLSGRVSNCNMAAIGGTATIADSLRIFGSLRLLGDHALDVGGGVLTLSNNLDVEGAARLVMDAPDDTVVVFGSAAFGGTGVSTLTDGLLRVEAGFVSSGTNTFAATGAHRTRLGGAPVDFFTINDDNGDLRFARVDLFGGSFVAAGTFTADSLYIDDFTTLTQTAAGQRVTVLGDVIGAGEGSLDVNHLTLGGRLEQDGGLSVDTLVLAGTGQRLAKYTTTGTQLSYQRVEVTGDVTTDIPAGETLTIADSVIVRENGSLRFTSTGFNTTTAISGNLTTLDNGVIRMDSLGTNVNVAGDALFAGGSTAGLIVAGTLEIAGSFTQTSANSPSSFQAGGTHFTRFLRTGLNPTVTFADPGYGAAQSRFNHFEIGISIGGTLRLASDVYASAQLLHSGISPVTLQQFDGQRALYSAGAAAGYLTFDGVRWDLGGSVPVDPAGLNQLSFINQDPTAVQFRIARDGSGGNVTLDGLSFATAPTGSGRYLVVEDTVANTIPLIVTVQGVSPAVHGGFAEAIGEALLDGWEAADAAVWLGTEVGGFDVPANWSTNAVPLSTDPIRVAGSTPLPLPLGTRTIGALTVETNGAVVVSGQVTVQRFLRQNGGSVSCSGGGFDMLNQTGLTQAIRLTADDCPVALLDGNFRLVDSTTSVQAFQIEGSATLDVNERLLATVGNFSVVQNGRIIMDQENDLLEVGGQTIFTGGDHTGSLTDGTIVAFGDFVQGGATPTSFVATDAHIVDFRGPNAAQVIVSGMSPTTSRFSRLYAAKDAPTALEFPADTVLVTGPFLGEGAMRFTGGSLIATGNTLMFAGHSVQMDTAAGIVDLRGALPSQCTNSELNVTGFRGQFLPTSCHTAPLNITAQVSSTTEQLNAVWATPIGPPGEVFAVGDNGVIRRSDMTAIDIPASLQWLPDSADQANSLYAIHGANVSPDWQVYAGGANGQIIWKSGLSSAWNTHTLPVPFTIRGVFVQDADSVWVVGDGGQVYLGSGSTWTDISGFTAQDLTSITRTDGTFLVTGTNGTVFESADGLAWSPRSVATSATVFAVGAVQAFGTFAAGADGTLLFDNGSTFSAYPTSPVPISTNWRSIAATDSAGVVVGDLGRVLQQQGSSWASFTTPSPVTLRGATVFPSIDRQRYVAIVVGDGGTIYYMEIKDYPPF